jgi:superfamily II DNA helicase RecQ
MDIERYSFLKKRAKLRMETLFAYVEDEHCRMKNLVAYFGENFADQSVEVIEGVSPYIDKN